MAKDEIETITINDKEYIVADFNETEMAYFSHIQDFDIKLSHAQFNLDQLNMGRQKALELLVASLDAKPEKIEAA